MAKLQAIWGGEHKHLFHMTLVLVLLSAPVRGVELGGYYKNLLIDSETVLGEKADYWLDINRLRLDISESWQQFELELVYDHEIQVGRYLETLQFRQLVEMDDPRYWEWQGNSLDRKDVYGSHQLYRGTVKYRGDNVDVRVGRQQINWATALIWNPLDLFNPLSPLQLERDERTGVDAVLLDISTQDLSRWSFVYAPMRDASDASGAVRFKSNAYALDWSIMTGKFANENKLGLGLASQVGMVGLRSEIVFSDSDTRQRYSEWVVSADYTTLSGTSFLIEGYFNGDGESTPANYDFNLLISGKKFGLARRYLGAKVEKDLTQLMTLALYAISNLDDHSYFLFPSASYAVPGFEDLYLEGGAQLFYGGETDEYGFFNHLYYTELTLYF